MEAYHFIFIAAGMMVFAVAALFFLANEEAKPKAAPQAPHKLQAAAEEARERRKKTLQGLQLEPWRQLRRQYKSVEELAMLFRQAGIASSAEQMRYMIIALSITLLFTLLAAFVLASSGKPIGLAILYSLFIFIALLFVMKRILLGRAQKRQQELEEETLMLIQTTRMLWRVGLSLPKTLAIVCDELRHLTPAAANELKYAVRRIDSGQGQDEALQELANNTTAEGFREYLIILRQQSTTGGAIDSSLQELYEVLQSRRKTELQEKVSKTAAKMSFAMMALLFPALLIIVGGPGFLAISRAMKHMAGH